MKSPSHMRVNPKYKLGHFSAKVDRENAPLLTLSLHTHLTPFAFIHLTKTLLLYRPYDPSQVFDFPDIPSFPWMSLASFSFEILLSGHWSHSTYFKYYFFYK